MLRAATKRAVFELLDSSYFGASNFTIEYGEGAPHWIRIAFIPNSNFHFVVQRSSLGNSFFQNSEAPGVKLLRPDHSVTHSFEDSIGHIPAWINRVKEEVIESNPINRELQSIRRQLEERIDLLAEHQDEYFTHAESNELAERLAQFAAKLDSISHENAEMRETVENIKVRLSELSAATQDVNKGTWLRMAGSRLLSATKAIFGSKEGREFALEAAKKVLLESPN